MAAIPQRPDPRGIPDVPDRALAQRPESLEDLALRIEMAELRVVRRDLEFRVHLDSLQQRGKAVLVPSRWLLPALGTGASWLFWRIVRRKPKGKRRDRDDHGSRHGQGDATPSANAAHGHGGGGGHLQLLTMLWGLVPLSLRGRVHPEIAQLLMGVVAGYLQGRKEQRAEAATPEHESTSGPAR